MDDTQALKHELAQALADLEDAATLGEINQTLVDLLEVIKARKADKQEPPQVTVNVAPAPVRVEVQPAAAHDFKFAFDYDQNGRLTGSTMTRIASKT